MDQPSANRPSLALCVRVDGVSKDNPCWKAEARLIGETVGALLESGGGVCGGRTVHLRCPEGGHPMTVLFQPMAGSSP